MVTLYQVLGVPRSATEAEIKSAFKALAIKYHPDKNPGNPEAEEQFKEINRAYQTLSDSYKRYQYDLSFEVRKPQPMRTAYEPFYYPPFAQKARYRKKEYVFGWRYVKAQAAAFVFIFVVAAMVMGVKYLYDDYKVAEEQRLAAARQVLFEDAQARFDRGEFRASLDIILDMYHKNPAERTITDYHDKFLDTLMLQAENHFQNDNYESAIFNFQLVKDYQIIENPVVYQKLAKSYIALGMYEETVVELAALQKRDKRSLKLNLDIGKIYYEKLEENVQAKQYLDIARKRVKEVITEIYGRAAELVMKPADSPQLYFDIFFLHGKLYTDLDLHEDAIKDLNWSVFLRPDLPEPYFLRGNNYQAIGNTFKACQNWKNAAQRQHAASRNLVNQYCN